MLLVAGLALAFRRPAASWGMLRQDWLTFVFRFIFLFGAGITACSPWRMRRSGRRGEFYLLLVVATLGMDLMASSADPDSALPGNRNHLYSALRPGWFPNSRCQINQGQA